MSLDEATTIAELKLLVDRFVTERDWHRFHAPKNLSMALAIEAAELMEHFQWISVEDSRDVAADVKRREAAGEELADVLCYALALANALGLDVSTAVQAKMIKNAAKYPVEKIRGRWGHGDPNPVERVASDDLEAHSDSATPPFSDLRGS